MLTDADEPARAAAARLAGYWKVESARPAVARMAEDPASSPAIRRAGVEALGAMGGQESAAALLAMTQPTRPLELRLAAVSGLTTIDVTIAARRAVDILSDSPSGTETDPLWDALIQRKGGPAALVAALNEQKLPSDLATAGLRRLSMSGQKQPGLEAALQAAGGSLQMPQQLTAEQLQQMIQEVRRQGDPARGQAVFRRASLLCVNCHAIAGAGGQVGPDLSSIGASAPVDYLIESLLEPSKKIKEGFHASIITRKDGGVAVGVVTAKTATELTLRDAADNLMIIPLDQVAAQIDNPVSLMPPGLTAQLRRDEFIDLVRFMSELGRPGPFAVGPERWVRRWRVLEQNSEFEDALRQGSIALAAGDHPKAVWRPIYSAVSGELAIDELPQLTRFFGRKFSYVRFQVEASAAGPAALRFNSPKGLSMWVGSERVDVADDTAIRLPAGATMITLAIDQSDRQGPLRIELRDVPDSPAQARLTTGK
jgi:putative heme-binding domain-containing protein